MFLLGQLLKLRVKKLNLVVLLLSFLLPLPGRLGLMPVRRQGALTRRSLGLGVLEQAQWGRLP